MPEHLTHVSGPRRLLFYRSSTGDMRIQLLFHGESFWMSQRAIAQLFGVGKAAISKHLKNIFASGELVEESAVSILETTAADGKNYQTKHYHLDAVIAVGYRVNSYQATQFRIWATKTLKEYVVKGFVIDDERLKQGQAFGQDYFDELLERIREIRASERRFYQKITDLYALAVDYDRISPVSRDFFASIQNKLHWAITGKTAAETIHAAADASRPQMGLTTWKRAPHGKVLRSDVTVAKNYLSQVHLQQLNRLVSAYLDLAENRADRRQVTTMAEWARFMDRFLELSDYDILQDKGRISAEAARIKAHVEYNVFRVMQDQDYLSDFDREVQRIQGKEK